MPKYGPWDTLHFHDDPPIFETNSGSCNIHQVVTRELGEFHDQYLDRPSSFFRFAELQNNNKTFLQMTKDLKQLSKHPDEVIQKWYTALVKLTEAICAFDDDLHSSMNEDDKAHYEFTHSKKMAEAAEDVEAGYVNERENFCPLNPAHDPDTDWTRWAQKNSPVEKWAFFRRDWMTKFSTKGGATVSVPYMLLDHSFEHANDNASWHPMWGYNIYGRFFKYLNSNDQMTLQKLAAPESGNVPDILKNLIYDNNPEIRSRACYELGKSHSKAYLSELCKAEILNILSDKLEDEVHEEVIRCILSAALIVIPFTSRNSKSPEYEKDISALKRIRKFLEDHQDIYKFKFPELFDRVIKGS
jgi:hypothetical protein